MMCEYENLNFKVKCTYGFFYLKRKYKYKIENSK